jgi:hypothetical protein
MLNEYMTIEKNVQAVSSEIGFRMAIVSGIKIRKPDLALIGTTSLKMTGPERTYNAIFDLCIEFLSDRIKSEIVRDTVQKKERICSGRSQRIFYSGQKRQPYSFFQIKQWAI